MVPYIILAAAMALIVIALRGLKFDDEEKNKKAGDTKESKNNSFDDILNSNLILERLDEISNYMLNSESSKLLQKMEGINERLDRVSLELERINGKPFDTSYDMNNTQFVINHGGENDINSRIIRMKDEGLDLAKIAESLSMTKGEVLLRLGMKK